MTNSGPQPPEPERKPDPARKPESARTREPSLALRAGAGMRDLTLLISAVAVTAGLAGCVDGPFYSMKRANPFFQREFARDREFGPTFEDRLQELDLLATRLPTMDLNQQQSWAVQLEQIMKTESSAEMRARIAKTVATLPADAAVRTLNIASADESEKVRLAACAAWKRRGDAAARDMLLSLVARADETTSVRQAAIDGLTVFDDAEVRGQMAQLLDDPSPAVQYQVAQSLQTMTGRDYGGDFNSWKQFLAGNDVPPPPPKSMTATIMDALPKIR